VGKEGSIRIRKEIGGGGGWRWGERGEAEGGRRLRRARGGQSGGGERGGEEGARGGGVCTMGRDGEKMCKSGKKGGEEWWGGGREWC